MSSDKPGAVHQALMQQGATRQQNAVALRRKDAISESQFFPAAAVKPLVVSDPYVLGEICVPEAKVFISHGERSERITRLRDALYSRMSEAESGFKPLLDEKDLPKEAHDTPWPEKLDEWVTCCHAAVVFLDDRALGRPWCQAEISHLMLRHRTDALPVVIIDGGFKPAKLKGVLGETAGLVSSQMIKIEGKSDDEVIKEVFHRIGHVPEMVNTSTPHSYASLVLHALRKVPEDELRQAARRLGKEEEFDRWYPGHPRWVQLAQWLFDAELQTVATALRSLPNLPVDLRHKVLECCGICRVAYADVKDVEEIVRGAPQTDRAFILRCWREPVVMGWQLHRPFPAGTVCVTPIPRKSASLDGDDDLILQVKTVLAKSTGDPPDEFDRLRAEILLHWRMPSAVRILTVNGDGVPVETMMEVMRTIEDLPLCIHGDSLSVDRRRAGVGWTDTEASDQRRAYIMAQNILGNTP